MRRSPLRHQFRAREVKSLTQQKRRIAFAMRLFCLTVNAYSLSAFLLR